MEWEKQKFLIELEIKKLRAERDSLLNWIRFNSGGFCCCWITLQKTD